MAHPIGISPTEAGKQVGRTKAAIIKAIRTGRMSATKNNIGEWIIDPAELFRVYQVQQTNDKPVNASSPPNQQGGQQVNSEIIALLKSQIEDLKQDRDNWKDQAQRLAINAAATTEKPKGFFKRLFS